MVANDSAHASNSWLNRSILEYQTEFLLWAAIGLRQAETFFSVKIGSMVRFTLENSADKGRQIGEP